MDDFDYRLVSEVVFNDKSLHCFFLTKTSNNQHAQNNHATVNKTAHCCCCVLVLSAIPKKNESINVKLGRIFHELKINPSHYYTIETREKCRL